MILGALFTRMWEKTARLACMTTTGVGIRELAALRVSERLADGGGRLSLPRSRRGASRQVRAEHDRIGQG